MQFLSRWRTALPAVAAVIVSLSLPAAFPFAASAQADGITAEAAAPAESSGVARIDVIAGDVAIQRGDSNDTLAAVPNAPVLGGDYVTTGANAHAEVGFDGRSAVRLGENVQIRFNNVDPSDRQMELAAGAIDLRLFGGADGQSAIDTPSISILPRTSGSFRVQVDANGETAVTVRAGRADIVTPQGTQSLESGTTLIADGPAANPSIQTQPAIALDAFDGYNGERDHIYQIAAGESQYVNSNIQGVGDLSGSGNWVTDGTYGHVWIPTAVPADWAPYRDGNWTWEDGYGWTWVAAEPWGWAPYHYGRWYFSTAHHHWAWYPPAPGRYAPAWSPALVGFVGFNIGAVNVGIGFGNIGWVPLAPFEAFHPWWGRGGTTLVNNVHYRNLMVNNAMTSVTRENFQAGRFGRRVSLSQEQLRGIHTVAVRGALPIVPSQANLRFAQRAAAPSIAVRASFMNRTFAGRPAFAQRTPFSEQQASVSRVTHVAYRHSEAAPAVTRPVEANGATFRRGNLPNAGANEPWSRFNANRNPERSAYTAPNRSPSFARPQAGNAPYVRPARPGGTYARPTNPGYARPEYNRQSAPSYNREAAPSYNRQSAPEYRRPAASSYNRQAAPAYRRPTTAARSARPAPDKDGHREH